MDIFALAAKLTLDSSEYERGIEAAKNAANSFGQGLSAVVSAVTNTDNAVSNAADSAENFGQKDRMMAKQAAIRMTRGSYTRVRFRTPVFSP